MSMLRDDGTSFDRRRRALLGGAAATLATVALSGRAEANEGLRFALTPVFLTSDLELIDRLRFYLETATGRPVELVSRRTYQEITAMLTAGQVDAAWLCGYPFVQHRQELELLAVPVWRGQPLYQSYLITGVDDEARALDDLAGDIHAFSDPDSNSGYLVTAAALADRKIRPDAFFGQTIFTYGHSNVVRAVAAGLARSGSVDGYVYEVLKVANPTLIASTKVIESSQWFGFPPIAAPIGAASSPRSAMLRDALMTMHEHPTGLEVLALLSLDRFSVGDVTLFDSISANFQKVRSLG